MADVRRAGDALRQPADGDDTAALRELDQERQRRRHLGRRRAAVRPRRGGPVRVRRHHVPAEDVGLDAELGERAADDGRRRLGRAGAGQLPLGGERDAAPSRATPPRRLAHEQHTCALSLVEVRAQPASPRGRAGALAVEVERLADARAREAPHEPFRVHDVTMLMHVSRRAAVLVALAAGVLAPAAAAAPPQGVQADAAFARSYGARSVAGVLATLQRTSCYAPEVAYFGS